MASGETYAEQVLSYVAQHPGCTRQQMEDDLVLYKSAISFSLDFLEEQGQVCRAKDSGDPMRRRFLYYPGKVPPTIAGSTSGALSEIYMHLSGNPWLTVPEVAEDLDKPPREVFLELQALLAMQKVSQRRRAGVRGQPWEFDVKPGSTPPLVIEVRRVMHTVRKIPPPAVQKAPPPNPVPLNRADTSAAREVTHAGTQRAHPLVNVVHGVHIELASPKGKIVLVVPHWTPEPDLKKAIAILEALLA